MKKLCIFLLLLFAATGILFAQEIEKSVKERLSNYFETYTPASANTGSCKLKSVDIDFGGRKLSIYTHSEMRHKFDQQGMLMEEKMGKKFFCCDAVLDTKSRQIEINSGWANEI